jgi:hypothetical protein
MSPEVPPCENLSGKVLFTFCLIFTNKDPKNSIKAALVSEIAPFSTLIHAGEYPQLKYQEKLPETPIGSRLKHSCNYVHELGIHFWLWKCILRQQ